MARRQNWRCWRRRPAHQHPLYDYYKLGEDRSVGFERTAALIAAARKEFANTLLFDNGDTIQGTALSDYQAQVKRLGCNEVLAMYKVMNALGTTPAASEITSSTTVLSFLSRVTGNRFNVDLRPGEQAIPAQPCARPNFPLVLANVLSVKTQTAVQALRGA